MIYYPRFIGDFARTTGHLTLMERGALNALLDHYYATDGDLPGGITALCRVANAHGDDERDAVGRVANAFFPFVEGRRRNGRADSEIAKIQAKSAGGRGRAAKMSASDRSKIAQRAANSRWFR